MKVSRRIIKNFVLGVKTSKHQNEHILVVPPTQSAVHLSWITYK